VVALSAALVIGVLVVAAAMLWRQRQHESRLAHARGLMAEANEVSADDYRRHLDLSLQSMRQAWTADGHGALLRGVGMLAQPLPATWISHPGPVRAMALSPDGRWLATASQGHLQVQAVGGAVYDLHSRNGNHYIHALAFSADSLWLAASCVEHEACLYDMRNIGAGQLVKRWQRDDGVLSAVAFTADGKWLATSAYTSPMIRLHAVGDEAEPSPILSGVERVGAIAFSPDGQSLAIVGEGSELWQVGPAERRKLVAAPEVKGRALTFDPDGGLLAVGGLPGPLRLLHVQGDPSHDTPAPGPLDERLQVAGGSQFSHVAFSTDGLYLAASDERTGVRVWQVGDGRLVAQAFHPAGALAFRGRLILTGGMDGRIIEWDPDGQPLQRIAHAGAVHAVALSPDSRWLASVSEGGRVRIFSSADGKESPSLAVSEDVKRLGFSRDGRWLAGFGGPALWLVATSGWRTIGPFVHDEAVLGVAFDADGERVATISPWDGFRVWIERMNAARQVRVWDIASLSELGRTFAVARRPRYDEAAVEAPRDPDEVAAVKQIAAGNEVLASKAVSWLAVSGAANVPPHPWLTTETAKGEPLSGVAQQVARGSHAAFSADGRLLASVSDHEVRLWQLKPKDLVADLCAKLQPVEVCPR
jgi:WD40 repeat protein